MQRMKTLAVIAGGLLMAGLAAQAQEGRAQKPAPPKPPVPASKHVMVAANDVKWGPGPAALPAGVEIAVLEGNPEKAGMFTIRAKFPDGYMVPPHSHPTDERVTIISGTLMMALGAKVDEAAMKTLDTGGYANMPARTNHYVRAKGETIVQINAMGPFNVTYVDPKDDPRKKTSTANK